MVVLRTCFTIPILRVHEKYSSSRNDIQSWPEFAPDGNQHVKDEIYGVCLRCEEPIAEKHLKAIPSASYCVNCQEAVDLERVFDGDDENTIGVAA